MFTISRKKKRALIKSEISLLKENISDFYEELSLLKSVYEPKYKKRLVTDEYKKILDYISDISHELYASLLIKIIAKIEQCLKGIYFIIFEEEYSGRQQIISNLIRKISTERNVSCEDLIPTLNTYTVDRNSLVHTAFDIRILGNFISKNDNQQYFIDLFGIVTNDLEDFLRKVKKSYNKK